MRLIVEGERNIDKNKIVSLRPNLVRAANNVTVNWSWYDETQGTVQWTFKNNNDTSKAVILFRNNYYFGNAFWSVYVANPEFQVSFASDISPYIDSGVANNSPKLGVVDFGKEKRIVAFVFVIAPNSSWGMLEGGFSGASPPSGAMLYEMGGYTKNSMCIKYDEAAVIAWDAQTQTTLQGYNPNPKTFGTVDVMFSAPYVELFSDSIQTTVCPTVDCEKVFTQLVGDIETLSSCFGISKLVSKLKEVNAVRKSEAIDKFIAHIKEEEVKIVEDVEKEFKKRKKE